MKELPNTRQELIGKSCRLFKRPNSSLWWVSIKLPKKARIYRSTGTDDAIVAHQSALDLYQSVQKRLANYGDLSIEKSATLSNLYDRFLEDDPTSKKAGTWRKDTIDDHMRLKWLPYLGPRIEIKATVDFEARLAGYVDWRRGKPSKFRRKAYRTTTGAKPRAGKSTLKLEYQSLLQVLRHGHKKGLIDRVPEIDFKAINLEWTQQDTKKSRRAGFTSEELLSFPDLLDDYINEEKVGYRSNHLWARKRLKAAVLLMTSTGIRPAEMRNLRNRDLVIEEHKGKEVLVVKIGRSKGGTKTIPHDTVANFFGDGDLPIEWIKSWIDDGIVSTNKTAFVFASKNGNVPRMTISNHFREFLLKYKIKTDKEFGKKGRSLYSIRHGVATSLLQRNLPINVISKSLGTSPEILLSSYDHTNIQHIKDIFLNAD